MATLIENQIKTQKRSNLRPFVVALLFAIVSAILVWVFVVLPSIAGGALAWFVLCAHIECSSGLINALAFWLLVFHFFVIAPILPGLLLFSFVRRKRILPVYLILGSLLASLPFSLSSSVRAGLGAGDLFFEVLGSVLVASEFLFLLVYGCALLFERRMSWGVALRRIILLIGTIIIATEILLPGLMVKGTRMIEDWLIEGSAKNIPISIFFTDNVVTKGKKADSYTFKSTFYERTPDGETLSVPYPCEPDNLIDLSRDKRYLVCYTSQAHGDFRKGLFLIDRDTEEWQKISLSYPIPETSLLSGDNLEFIPGRREVLWSAPSSYARKRGEESLSIFKYSLATGKETEIYQVAGNYATSRIAASPDGEKIAVAVAPRVSLRDVNDGVVAIVDPNGKKLYDLPDELSCCAWYVQWSHDGNRLFVASLHLREGSERVESVPTRFSLYDIETGSVTTIKTELLASEDLSRAIFAYNGTDNVYFLESASTYSAGRQSIYRGNFHDQTVREIGTFPSSNTFAFIQGGEWHIYRTSRGYWLAKTGGDERYRILSSSSPRPTFYDL